jgi:hypothetical protein
MKPSKLLLAFLLLTQSLVSFSQTNADDIDRKKANHEEEVKLSGKLEEKSQNGGLDFSLREHSNIPIKKIDPEESVANSIDEKSDTKNINSEDQSDPAIPSQSSRESELIALPEKSEQSLMNPQASSESPNQKNIQSESKNFKAIEESTKQISLKWDIAEVILIAGVCVLLLTINFVLYCTANWGRFLLVATPFDIGVRWKKNDLEKSARIRKYFAEIFLFGIFVYFMISIIENGKNTPTDSYVAAATLGIISYFGLHFLYIVSRALWGISSSCPKCRTSFSAQQTSTWEEPKVTYKRISQKRSTTIEKGIQYREYSCCACGHEWKKQSSYEKELHTNFH